MTRSELAAFNAGVKAALSAASMAADAIEKRAGFREGREGFGSAALRGFAEAGAELLVSSEVTQAGVGAAECGS